MILRMVQYLMVTEGNLPSFIDSIVYIAFMIIWAILKLRLRIYAPKIIFLIMLYKCVTINLYFRD